MKAYGIPDKVINVVKPTYENFECSVVDEGELTDWFRRTSGVKQGCVMSGFLFLVVVDWVMRRTTEGNELESHGIFTNVL